MTTFRSLCSRVSDFMTSPVRTLSVLVLPLRAWRLAVPVGCAALLLGASVAVAQQARGQTSPTITAAPDPSRIVAADTPDATRAELTLLLEQSMRQASDGSQRSAVRERAQADITTIRRRLEFGDYQPGDRFMLTIRTDSLARVEVVVRAGPSIDFGNLSTLSLVGVLHAETDSVVTKHFRRFYQAPEITVHPLTRVSLLGAVLRPGPVSLPPDAVVSDVFTVAGLQANANTQNVVVRRDGREIIDGDRFSQAVRDGLTLDSLGLRTGDEIRVAAHGRRNWRRTLWTGMMAFSIVTGLLAFIRSSYAD